MNPSIRTIFNQNFTEEKYADFLVDLNAGLRKPVEFRVAETPVFLTDDFRDKLIQAGQEIIDVITAPGFKELSEHAIPDKWRVANENDHPHFIALDFGVCKDDADNIVPKLIEMQGFPSLYGFQLHLGERYRHTFNIPGNQTIFFNGLNKSSYLDLLKETIIGPYQPDEVVLMDVNAPDQKTAVDFYLTEKYIGTPVVSLTDLIQEGDQLFYHTVNGDKKRIRRVYNRLIFDEIENNPEIFNKVVDIRKPLDVEWITHPNWFYRISKYTMPFLKGKYVPKTQFVSKLAAIPDDLQNYVLKPLFSFAGQGVMIDVMDDDLTNLPDPENWILQEKVDYVPVIQSPDGGVKAELRLLYLWPKGHTKPTLAVNLARLSRGKMIGVRYNKDFDWVGGTVAFMHK
ncbi:MULTISPECIES: hypothetical protein [unclassified Mucilaginibacter]|uniref:hypothetical protein n=1 Tax=unclassified Mucilaginibacter TaxID=2617802 RepID=UPI0009616EAB|nr:MULTISPECIES: hypothetical protein [unclassified Mucilaginibacter]OJW12727.1 MAG: hypothetical protein BGO48_02270 [Mucilaginibacter sp. 44-25]PLW90475.1 MAG: hypothetical protein C0154_06220 [Mucilaginibacter sp.]HEK18934.1 hypothetical protein [Bacteroidota bacterium]